LQGPSRRSPFTESMGHGDKKRNHTHVLNSRPNIRPYRAQAIQSPTATARPSTKTKPQDEKEKEIPISRRAAARNPELHACIAIQSPITSPLFGRDAWTPRETFTGFSINLKRPSCGCTSVYMPFLASWWAAQVVFVYGSRSGTSFIIFREMRRLRVVGWI
jgi:hypothetical protein